MRREVALPQGPATEAYTSDGFCVLDYRAEPAFAAAAAARVDAVVAGDYDTGTPPLDPRDDAMRADTMRLVKIDQPHWADHTLHRAVSDPALGAAVAEVLGVRLVQVWAVQLLSKPSGHGLSAVGWHQDQQYWQQWWDGEAFTVWLALDDITVDKGPVRFVRGSHRWGLLDGGDFFGNDLDALRSRMAVPADAVWDEVPMLLPTGGVSLHHRLTIHGSGANTSGTARRALAIHLRSEHTTPKPVATPGHEAYVGLLHDLDRCPVIHDARSAR